VSKPYHLLLDDELSIIQKNLERGGNKPSLLLHACCGPCSSYILEYLLSFFSITVYFYNTNIHPEKEYKRRLSELEKFIQEFMNKNTASIIELVIEGVYDPEEYFTATGVKNNEELQNEREKGERCRRCYKFRMENAFKYACENEYDYMTTTLSISPHKDADKINAIGKELKNEGEKPVYLYADFKKKGGFKRSLELSEEYGLYRQDYCGCIYSMRKPQILE